MKSPGIQASIASVKASSPPFLAAITLTNEGPTPLPRSSNTLKIPYVVPRVDGRVTFLEGGGFGEKEVVAKGVRLQASISNEPRGCVKIIASAYLYESTTMVTCTVGTAGST